VGHGAAMVPEPEYLSARARIVASPPPILDRVLET
jgi:hypothetical protein